MSIMKRFALSIILNALSLHSVFADLNHVHTKVRASEQERAAADVVRRLFPTRHDEFQVHIVPTFRVGPHQLEKFRVEWDSLSQKVVVTGTTAVVALFGLNFYLKYYCKCHIAWEGKQLRLPDVLPQIFVERIIYDRFRYYQNACTDSYSFVWWDWTQWEEHIDWMALSGINLPLAFTGQEAIWVKLYKDLGLSEDEILGDYVTGPAFLAWWRMGNIQAWGGPLPQSYLQTKLDLLKKIVSRMRSLGMTPVLPVFSGNVPKGITRVFPNAHVVHHSSWNNFNATYSSTYMLQPTDPLFLEIGRRFIAHLTEETGGTDHIYSCDTFNENRPVSNASAFLAQMARSTYMSMAAADKKAVWVIQSWVFTDTEFWKIEQIRSYLSGVDPGKALVLDLEAELFPLYLPYQSFFNHSFIWCMLHNFGGTHGMYGALGLVNEGVPEARKHGATMVGTGLCPEGINQNYFIYDFMSEASLRQNPINTTDWALDYQERRYGIQSSSLRSAWAHLSRSIYNGPPLLRFHGRTLITRRPSFKLREKIWYNISVVSHTLDNFIAVSENEMNDSPSSLYYYDMVDITRQFLQVLVAKVYKQMLGYFYTANFDKFEIAADQLLSIIDDLESVLATNKNFMLGPWLADAQRWGQTWKEKELLRFNALNQITLWGPNGEIVDYAAKQWAGMISGYYRPRWALFIDAVRGSYGKTFPYKYYLDTILNDIEIPFTYTSHSVPVDPTGDTTAEAVRIYGRWKDLFNSIARRSKGRRDGFKASRRKLNGTIQPTVASITRL